MSGTRRWPLADLYRYGHSGEFQGPNRYFSRATVPAQNLLKSYYQALIVAIFLKTEIKAETQPSPAAAAINKRFSSTLRPFS